MPTTKKFINATGHAAPRHWENRKHPKGEDNLPVVYVNWKAASAYSQWVGKRLPTEIEMGKSRQRHRRQNLALGKRV